MLMGGNSNATTQGEIRVFQGQGAWYDSIQKRIARFTQEPVGNFETGFFTQYQEGHDKPMRRDWYVRGSFLFHNRDPRRS
jgi:hypothetical protein